MELYAAPVKSAAGFVAGPLYQSKVYPAVMPPTDAEALPELTGEHKALTAEAVATIVTVLSGIGTVATFWQPDAISVTATV